MFPDCTILKIIARWINGLNRTGLNVVPAICLLQGTLGAHEPPTLDIQRLIKLSLLPLISVIGVVVVFLGLRYLLLPRPLDADALDPEAMKIRMEALAKEKLSQKLASRKVADISETVATPLTSVTKIDTTDLEGESLV